MPRTRLLRAWHAPTGALVAHAPAGKGNTYLQHLIAEQIRADVEDDIASSDVEDNFVDKDEDASIASAATSKGGSV